MTGVPYIINEENVWLKKIFNWQLFFKTILWSYHCTQFLLNFLHCLYSYGHLKKNSLHNKKLVFSIWLSEKLKVLIKNSPLPRCFCNQNFLFFHDENPSTQTTHSKSHRKSTKIKNKKTINQYKRGQESLQSGRFVKKCHCRKLVFLSHLFSKNNKCGNRK